MGGKVEGKSGSKKRNRKRETDIQVRGEAWDDLEGGNIKRGGGRRRNRGERGQESGEKIYNQSVPIPLCYKCSPK